MAGRFRLLVLLMFLVVRWSVVMLVYYARGAEQRQAQATAAVFIVVNRFMTVWIFVCYVC